MILCYSSHLFCDMENEEIIVIKGDFMFKHFFCICLILIMIPSKTFASISGTLSETYSKEKSSAGQMTFDITVNCNVDINKNLSFYNSFESDHIPTHAIQDSITNTYVQYNNRAFTYSVGRQGYTLSSGLLADISGTNSIVINETNKDAQVSTFYGRNDTDIFAVDFKTANAVQCKNLIMEAAYLKTNKNYMGVRIVNQMTNDNALAIEGVENLNTKACGYRVNIVNGSLEKNGDRDIGLSFRDIQSGAVSEYSADANYDDSIGFRIRMDYQLADNIVLDAYHDIARTQAGINIDKTQIEASMNF